MKWRILFSVLFIASVVMMLQYANKSLVVYSRTANENVPDASGGYFTDRTTRTYQDNYASIGGVIGFGILAGAALVGFALTIRKQESNKI